MRCHCPEPNPSSCKPKQQTSSSIETRAEGWGRRRSDVDTRVSSKHVRRCATSPVITRGNPATRRRLAPVTAAATGRTEPSVGTTGRLGPRALQADTGRGSSRHGTRDYQTAPQPHCRGRGRNPWEMCAPSFTAASVTAARGGKWPRASIDGRQTSETRSTQNTDHDPALKSRAVPTPAMWTHPEDVIMPREKSWTRRARRGVVPLRWGPRGVRATQTGSGGRGRRGGRGVRVSWGQSGSWEDGESWRWWWRRLHSRVTVPNAAELCAEKR